MKCLFVYNPESGKGKILKHEKYIKEKLSSIYQQVDVIKSEYAGHIFEIVRDMPDEYDTLVVAGGDGTLNEVINALGSKKKKPKIGYIPTGTVNDVAHSLDIPRSIKGAVDNILQQNVFKHDIFRMNDRFGIYVCCAGVFTESSYATGRSTKKHFGRIAYFFHGVKKIFTSPSIELKLTLPDGTLYQGKFALLLVVNSRYVAGFKLNKRASLNDGLIDVLLVRSKRDTVSLGGMAKVAGLFVNGVPLKQKKGIIKLRTNSFKLETNSSTTINLDGEKVGLGSFDFEVLKEAVEIFVPKID